MLIYEALSQKMLVLLSMLQCCYKNQISFISSAIICTLLCCYLLKIALPEWNFWIWRKIVPFYILKYNNLWEICSLSMKYNSCSCHVWNCMIWQSHISIHNDEETHNLLPINFYFSTAFDFHEKHNPLAKPRSDILHFW